ncbi:MAG: SPOR domain-containing protein [Pseudomonadota bacterium]
MRALTLITLAVALFGVIQPYASVAQSTRNTAASIEPAMAAYRAGAFQTAFKSFLNQASLGSRRAATIVGMMYAWGEGVRQDDGLAAYWYEQGARRGDPVAQFYLANAYINGVGLPNDLELGRMWLNRAAEHGHSPARVQLDAMALGRKTTVPRQRPGEILASLRLDYIPGDEARRVENLRPSSEYHTVAPIAVDPVAVDPVAVAPVASENATQGVAPQPPPPTSPAQITQPKSLTEPTPLGSATAPARPTSGYVVQLEASRDQQRLVERWAEIRASAPEIFSGLSPRYEATNGTPRWYRLRVGFFRSHDDARAMCQRVLDVKTVNDCWPVLEVVQ